MVSATGPDTIKLTWGAPTEGGRQTGYRIDVSDDGLTWELPVRERTPGQDDEYEHDGLMAARDEALPYLRAQPGRRADWPGGHVQPDVPCHDGIDRAGQPHRPDGASCMKPNTAADDAHPDAGRRRKPRMEPPSTSTRWRTPRIRTTWD